MKKIILLSLFLLIRFTSFAQNDQRVILITLDGLRWQEVFGGAVDSMMQNEEITEGMDQMLEKYSASDKESARQKLMPWFWSTLVKDGQLYGNRWKGSMVNCTNEYWFSYPGYNEILTGLTDPKIDSNDKIYNSNKTILEWINEQPSFAGKVAAFGSWDVFPYIINDKRSGIPVNAGFMKAAGQDLTEKEKFLNTLLDEVPSPWGSVRLDAFTHHYAMEYMKKNHPKLVYISYGETDDFAHDGRYDHYLNSAHNTDGWIQSIWEYVNEDPFYKGKTNILITTDHGRGSSPMMEWKSHGTKIKDSNQIWIGAIGPNISALGEVKGETQLYQNQIAATIAKLLGFEGYKNENGSIGAPIKNVLPSN